MTDGGGGEGDEDDVSEYSIIEFAKSRLMTSTGAPVPWVDHTLSIDPGTRNFACALLRYEPRAPPTEIPETVEQFLANVHLVNWTHVDFGTAHVDTVCSRFGTRMLDDPDYEWVVSQPGDVIIEQQGNTRSAIVNMCHMMRGFFMAAHRVYERTPRRRCTYYVDYPATRKFRGDFVDIAARTQDEMLVDDARVFDLIEAFEPGNERDPLKRAAIILAQRLLTHIHVDETALVNDAVARGSQQHLADALCQGVSWLYHKYVRFTWSEVEDADGARTYIRSATSKRTREIRVEHVHDPGNDDCDDVATGPRIEDLVAQPREGRKSKGATRTTAVRSQAAKRKRVYE